jgi:hypothetical protein
VKDKLCKQDQAPFSRYPAPKGNQHLLLHSIGTGPIEQTAHIRLHLLQFLPTERRTTLHTPHSWHDPINYPGNKATPTTDLTTAKLLINSTISTPGAIFLGINLTNFYLNTPMPNPKYMRL